MSYQTIWKYNYPDKSIVAEDLANGVKPYVTVSAKGVSNGLSDLVNDGADFGPDTPGTQTYGIQEALNTNLPVRLLPGIYDIYDELIPDTVLDIEMVTNGALPTGIPSITEPTYYIQQNTAGKNIIHIKKPLNVLRIKNIAFQFGQYYNALSSTGHGIFVDAKTYLDANPPQTLAQTCMGGFYEIENIFGQYVDTSHYLLYLDNILDGTIKNIFGNGGGGFLHMGTYIPSGASVGLNSGNTMLLGYWQFNQTNSTSNPANVPAVDFSAVSNQTGINSGINFIDGSGALFDLNFGAIASGVPAINFQAWNNNVGSQFIIFKWITGDANIGTPPGQELIINVAGTAIEYIQIGSDPVGATYPNGRGGMYVPGNLWFAGNSSFTNVLASNGIISVNSNFVVEKTLYPLNGIGTNGITSTPSISANPPISGTVYQNTNPYDIEISLPVYASTSGTNGTVAYGISKTSTITLQPAKFISGSTSSSAVEYINIRVPNSWYYEFVGTNVTFGTAIVNAL